MTKQEFNDLHDSLYYGHDAEIEVDGQKFFIEWEIEEIMVYAMNGNEGEKIASIKSDEKLKVIEMLFGLKLSGEKCLSSSYDEINIIDIE